MHDLLNVFKDRLISGLRRKGISKCSQWAEQYRIMGPPFPGKWTFRYHPWLKEMHDSQADFNVGQKAAQMGFTETALNITFYHIDIKGVDCLYVLPTRTPDASDFSASRFDPALELSPHLHNLFSDVKNVGHKRAGNANLFVRGSRSRSGLKSIPVGLIVIDELDEADQKNIPLALERTAGQVEKMNWLFSTPTLPGVGINKEFRESTQEYFTFKCPACGKFTELTFPECIEITAETTTDPNIQNSFYKCRECKNHLPHKTKPDWLKDAQWIPSFADRTKRGFAISQLYSCVKPPQDIAKAYLDSLKDPYSETEFYNSTLGVEHIVEGAGITDSDIIRCIGSHRRGNPSRYNKIVTIGIDVGRWLHYEINEWDLAQGVSSIDLNVLSKPKVIDFGKLQHFEELDALMVEYRIMSAVIDANPERRKAFEFAMRFSGLVRLCFYGVGIRGKQINIGHDEEPTVTVDRTSWLDLSLGRFKAVPPAISIPFDLSHEYKDHLKSMIRVFEKDRMGNPVGRYRSDDEDHYAHARNYAEIALPFALSISSNQNVDIF